MLLKRLPSIVRGIIGLLFLCCTPLQAADTGTLVGTVTDSTSGLPLSGVLIQIKLSGSVVASTTTNTSGAYTITVTQNFYDVVASKSGYSPATATNFRIKPNQTTTLNFGLQTLGSITGTVTDVRTGLPLQNVSVQASQSGTVIGSAITASNGTYTISSLAPGSYTVTATLTNYTTSSNPATVTSGQTTQVSFALLPNPGTVAGTVTDSVTHLGIPGATITITQSGATIATSTANSSGGYSIAGIYPATNYSVQASTVNYTSQTQTSVTVTSNATTTANFSLVPQAGSLSGTVRDAVTSGTLNGVTIDLLSGGTVIKTTTTGGVGEYTITDITPGSYTVRATLSHYQSQSTSTAIYSNQTTPQNVNLQPNSGSITGTITDSTTVLPIQGVTVQALQGQTVMATTTSASDGTYTMSGLVPGSYTVQASKIHYQTGSSSVAVVSDSSVTANLALSSNPGSLSGVVTDSVSLSPLSGVTVALSKGGSPVASTTTAANGTYSFSSLAPATNYSVQVSLAHYQTQNISPITISSDQTTTENISLVPSTGTITGTVQDSLSHGGISGVTITALQAGTVIQTTTTGGGGTYTFSSPFTPGNYTIQATITHYQSGSQTTSVTSDTASTVDFSLVPNPGSIAGTVTDSITGDPLGSVTISIRQGGSEVASTTTATNGTYTVSSLTPGSYDVHADKTNYNPQTASSISVTSDSTQIVNFSLVPKPGAIHGTVSDESGVLSGATVEALQGGTVVASTTTAVSGTYTLSSLNPGTYSVRTSASSHGTATYASPVTVVANTTTNGINFTLPFDPGTIAGHVYDSTPSPLSGVTVTVLQGSTFVVSTTTNGSGFYTLPDLSPGTYTVEAQKNLYETATQSATVTAGSTTTKDFTLNSTPGTISGTVTIVSTSTGIANATVDISKGGTFITTTTTASDGTYTASNLAPGSDYSVTTSATHYASSTQTPITVTASSTTTVNFGLTPNNGTISGSVTDSVTHAGIVGATVRALQSGSEKGTATTGPGGSYTISPTLPPGNYDVEVSATSYQTTSVSTIVVSDQTITVDVSLVSNPGTISGTITTTLSGAPIAGATVDALQGGTIILSTSADGSGVYSLSGLAPGSYDVRASATNYETATQTGVTVTAEQTTTANISLVPQPGAISGTVTDSSMSPLEGATVDALQGGIIIATTTTVVDGSYHLTNLQPGSYIVRVNLDTYQTSFIGAIIDSNQTATADLVLQSSPRTIDGTVTDTTTPTPGPIAGATVDILQGNIVLASATTDTYGAYSVSSLAPGIYTVRASATGYQTSVLSANLTTAVSATVNFALTLSPHTIAGTAQDSITSNPINGALIEVLQGQVQLGSALTDASGAYSIPGLPPGTYSVRATAQTYQTITSTAIVMLGVPTTTVNFSLERSPGTITGKITHSVGGAAIPSAAVDVLQGAIVIQSIVTDVNGDYIFSSLKPGIYTVRASATTFQSGSQTATVSADQTTIVNITLAPSPGSITGYVTNPTPLPIAGATVVVLENGSPIASTVTAPDGSYTVTGLAPGTYIVRASATDSQTSSQGTTVVPDATSTVNFTLQPSPGAIDGTVTDSVTSNPLQFATVDVIQNSSIIVASTGTDALGKYSISGLAPGTYTVRASLTNYQTLSIGAFIQPNTTTTVDLALVANPGTISGQVTDQTTGTPLANASINIFLGQTLIASINADINGSYSINSLAPGTYSVRASRANYQTATLGATVTSGLTTTVSFQLLPSPGQVDGTISASGIPQQGAIVEIFNGSILIASTLSESNGTYALTGVSPGSYIVRVTLAGYQITQAGATVYPSTATIVNFTLYSANGSLSGHVQDQLLNPISGATIDLLSGATIVASAITDPQGNYTILSLAPVTYTVRALAPNFQIAQQTATVVLPPSPTTQANFTLLLNPGTIEGSVTSSTSSPIFGATVTVSLGGTVVSQVITDADGTFSISNLAPKTYTVGASATNFQAQTQTATVSTGSATTVNFVLGSSPGTLTGTVTDDTSHHLSGATIDVVFGSNVIASALTANDGTYTITGLAPKTYIIRAALTAYQTGTASAIIYANQTTAANFALLSSPGSISGQVDDNSTIPNPIPGASVDLYQNAILISSTTTDAVAQYSFPNLAPNTYTVRAGALNYQSQILGALVRSLQNTQVTFSLQQNPGTITGTVTDSGTTLPIQGAFVQALVKTSVIASTFTDAHGTYTLSGLSPTSYTVQVTHVPYTSQDKGASVSAGSTVTVDFALASTQGSFIGRVTDSSTAQPISGATIIVSQGAIAVASTQTDTLGQYVIANLEPGQYIVHGGASSYQSSAVLGSVVVNASTTVNLQLQPTPGALRGIVTDALSNPISGASLTIRQNNIVVALATTSATGEYYVSGFAPGTYVATASAPGYIAKTSLGFAVAAGQTVTENFVMESNPGTLGGTITDTATSQPISGATIDVLRGTVVIVSSFSTIDGTYSIDGLPPVTYTVRVSQKGYQIAAQGATVYPSLLTTSNFALRSNPGTIEGTISDVDSGSPIPGATINLIQGATIIDTILNDDNGQYIVPSLPPGQYVVQAIASGYGTKNVGAALTEGGTAQVSFPLSKATGTITGIVRNAINAAPIGGAIVGILQNSQIVKFELTSADGTYTISDIASGSYTVRVLATGFQTTSLGAIVLAGETIRVDFALRSTAGSISGTVTNTLSSPISGASVQVIQALQPLTTVLTDMNGDYVIQDLPPGTYSITATADGYQTQLLGASVPETGVNFVLTAASPLPSVQGHVYDVASGASLAGTLVEILDQGVVIAKVVADTDGAYTLSGLADGSYSIRASVWEYQTGVQGVVVRGTEIATSDFYLIYDAGSLDGTITDATTHNPIANAIIQLFMRENIIATKVTSPDGQYLFTDLPTG